MKKIVAILLALTVIMTFVACGGNETVTSSGDDAASAADTQETSDEVVTVDLTLTSQEDQYRLAVDNFNSSRSDIAINLEIVPDQQLGTILNETMGTPDAPDIVWGTIRTEMWAYAGMIEPLNAYIERDSYDMSGFYPFAVEHSTINGELYGMPKGSDTYAFAINKAVFAKYGVEVPAEGDWTWDDVEALSRELQTAIDAQGGHETALGMQLNDSIHGAIPMMVGNGADIFNEDGTATGLNTPESVKMLEIINQMVIDGVALDAATVIETRASALLGSGLVGICNMASYPNSLVLLEDSEGVNDVQFMPWPLGPDTGTNNLTNIVTNNFVMNSGSDNKDAAWEVMKYLGSAECDAILSEARAHFPAHAVNAELWVNSGVEGLNYQYFADMTEKFQVVTLPNNQMGYFTQLNANLLPLWEGDVTAQEALNNLEAGINGQIGGLVAS